ncbi:ATP-binding protein [Zoogloea sp.]|uniref:ATP-binding protein n=1 Tax=Zoogloea sp. TaxID=49181 RepID=UPI002603F5F3|nr:ATP-binding protein [Zoogloea sp.]MDD3352706.1 ATP-binding protein [Zoogloea sp.]
MPDTSPTPHAFADRARQPWARFILPLLALSLIIAGLGTLAYRYLSEEIRKETHRTLAVITEQKRQQIENWLGGIRIDAELYFSGHSQFEMLYSHWLRGGRRENGTLLRMRMLMDEVAQVRGWEGVAVIDARGTPAFVIGQAAPERHAVLIRDILARPRIQLVDLHRTARGDIQYGVLAPIGQSGAPALGVAYISLRADRSLYPLVESWPVPTRSAETYLVRPEDQAVRFLTPLRHQQDAALNLTRNLNAPELPAARAASGNKGILAGGRDYRGMSVLAYAAPVAGTPWLMIAEMDEQEAYAGIRTMAWATALVMGLGLIFVYSAGYLLWRRQLQSQELTALRAQRSAEARFRVVFEQAPLGVALLDSRDNRIIEANCRFAEIIGRRPEEIPGLDPMVITHPDDVPVSRRQLGRLHTGELHDYGLAKRYLRPDGTVVWINLSCAPVQVENEETPRYLAIVEDITERRQMEGRLEEARAAAEAANAAKSEFLAHMSHEIRTPMNAVLGLAQVLERDNLSPSQREMVERIRGAGQSLLAILNDVLDLSKIEAGQLRIEPRPFNLAGLLANVDSLMGQAARAKGLTLHMDLPPAGLGLLVGDGLRLEQILLNLCGNAIKFTAQGEVAVGVRQVSGDTDGVRLRFQVRDTGIGIAPDALERLFTPFTQADAGIGRRFGGTGLGLSICKRLVEMMGGRIGVQSDVGEGSTFWFELPFARARKDAVAPAAVPAPPGARGPRLSGTHVLVVDDSAMNRDLVERALRLEGATATLAADGQQALQLLRTRPDGFDAVLMDVQMPVMDGLTATRLIRSELGLLELPVLAFTAGVRDEQQAAVRAAGANDVLPKPMDLEQMTTLLGRWISPRVRLPDLRAPAVEEDGEGIPAIPGIDQALACQRLGGDRSMFLSLLALFIEDNAHAAQDARKALASGDREEASRRMHTLRSNAGFLGALALMDEARRLERAIEEGEDDLDPRLVALDQQITTLIDASSPWREVASA